VNPLCRSLSGKLRRWRGGTPPVPLSLAGTLGRVLNLRPANKPSSGLEPETPSLPWSRARLVPQLGNGSRLREAPAVRLDLSSVSVISRVLEVAWGKHLS
jgi:hypothetical protein